MRAQDGRMRASVIGCYAPMEPLVMDGVLKFLACEKKYPLALVHRIIDRLASTAVTATVVTHDEAVAFIKDIPPDFAIVSGPCACRLNTAETLGPDARDLSSGKLEFCRKTPLNVDIQIAKNAEKFGKLESYSPISKDDLLRLEEECLNMGLVANIYTVMDGEAGICHCSSATCIPFLANEAIGGSSSVIKKGAFLPVTDKGICTGTGDCVKVCHFGARSAPGRGKKAFSTVDSSRCHGCGLCARVCPENAISMTARRR
ncbi:MAG: 4Fe-4S binding protein [Deltaproteobacteria bacterium]|nr:4Fe-4S binding protein [Deltaproteobacteria bacterium]